MFCLALWPKGGLAGSGFVGGAVFLPSASLFKAVKGAWGFSLLGRLAQAV
ncbi:hypothetical protein S1OALGB6SA_77 [Olavius algarvensis spirochete endosymbiont]|nr:hypothetical protein S1OALGB6SA_77 [Olavius algarvensis spirochete endosymbiont]